MGLVGTTLDQRFSLESVVARGGFGVVFKGTQLELARPVAVKVLLLPEDGSESVRDAWIECFRAEARTVARLRHPSIVQVLDYGVVALSLTGERTPWMALEWLDGRTLTSELEARRGEGRHPTEALALLRPVLEAIAYAHEEGVAHRDLKPSNVMLVEARRGTAAYVLDFGIAKVVEQGEQAGSGNTSTQTALPAFSPAYAAPEQIGHTRTGPWTDVHALGLMLTELLTGQPAYQGTDNTTRYIDALSSVRPTPGARGVEVGAWEPVLRRALSLAPDARYPDAGALLAALDEALPRATWARKRAAEHPSVTGPDPALDDPMVPPPPRSQPSRTRGFSEDTSPSGAGALVSEVDVVRRSSSRLGLGLALALVGLLGVLVAGAWAWGLRRSPSPTPRASPSPTAVDVYEPPVERAATEPEAGSSLPGARPDAGPARATTPRGTSRRTRVRPRPSPIRVE